MTKWTQESTLAGLFPLPAIWSGRVLLFDKLHSYYARSCSFIGVRSIVNDMEIFFFPLQKKPCNPNAGNKSCRPWGDDLPQTIRLPRFASQKQLAYNCRCCVPAPEEYSPLLWEIKGRTRWQIMRNGVLKSWLKIWWVDDILFLWVIIIYFFFNLVLCFSKKLHSSMSFLGWRRCNPLPQTGSFLEFPIHC